MNKQELREEIKSRFSAHEKNLAPMAIEAQKRFLALPEYAQARTVLIYMPLPFEADTSEILKDALKNKKVYVPHTGDALIPARVDKDTRFVLGKYKIAEPSNLILEPSAQIDLAVIPLRAFDRGKNRLGRGKGYYDRFLDRFGGVKIGLAFSFQEAEFIEKELHDVRLDKIVTEKEVIN